MDRESLSELYYKYGPLVLRRARYILRNEHDAEDIVQEVFQVLVENPDIIKNQDAIVSWFYRTTTNRALNRIRGDGRMKARHQAAGSEQSVPAGTNPDSVLILQEVMADLPPKVSAAAIYFYIDRMTLTEIAKAVGVSRRTVANLLKKFRTIIEKRTGRAP